MWKRVCGILDGINFDRCGIPLAYFHFLDSVFYKSSSINHLNPQGQRLNLIRLRMNFLPTDDQRGLAESELGSEKVYEIC